MLLKRCLSLAFLMLLGWGGVLMAAEITPAPAAQEGAEAPDRGPLLESLNLNQMPLKDLCRMLAENQDWPVAPSAKAADIKVSLYLKNVRCEDALRLICQTSGLVYRKDKESNIYRVMTAEEARNETSGSESVEVLTIYYPSVVELGETLRNLYPDRVVWQPPSDSSSFQRSQIQTALDRMDILGGRKKLEGTSTTSSSSGSSSSGNSSTGTNYNSNNVTSGGASALSTPTRSEHTKLESSGDIFGATGVDPTKAAGAVYISALPNSNDLLLRSPDPLRLKEIMELAKKMDKPSPQVLLEVKVLDVQLDDTDARGIDWLFQDGTSNKLTGGFAPNGAITAPNALLTPQGTDSRALVFNYITDDLRARITLLEQQNRLTRLATPNLFVADNEASQVFVGSTTTILESVSTNTYTYTTGSNPYTTTTLTPTTSRVKIGSSLTIAPKIHADRTVTIRLLQENTAAGQLKTINYGTTNSFTSQDVEERTVVTTVQAKDGNLVAIGGLISEEISENTIGIPWLKDIPWVGNLFKSVTKTQSRHELMVLIRPFVLLAPGENENFSMDFLERVSKHPAATKDLPELGVGLREELPVGSHREEAQKAARERKVRSMTPE